jgi:hypothetical protein
MEEARGTEVGTSPIIGITESKIPQHFGRQGVDGRIILK